MTKRWHWLFPLLAVPIALVFAVTTANSLVRVMAVAALLLVSAGSVMVARDGRASSRR